MPESNDHSSAKPKPKRKRSKDPFSFRKLGPGRWQVQVTVGYSPQGGQRRKSRVLYGNEKDARKQAWDFASEHGQPSGQKKTIVAAPVQSVMFGYIAACGADWAPKTLLEQRRFMNTRLGSLADIPIRDLSKADVRKWTVELRKDGLKASSVRRILAVLKAGLTWAVDMELVDSNPAASVRVKTQSTVKPRLPSEHALRDYVGRVAEHDQRFGALLRLAVETGARRGELAGLKVSNLNEGTGEVTFKRVITESESGMVEKPYLKAAKFKKLAVNPATLDSVLAIAPTSGFVFSDDGGRNSWRVERITKTHLRYRRRYHEETGTDVGRFHGMRDFHATYLLASGEFSVADVAQRLGHSSPATTLNSYAHAIKAHDKKAGDYAASMFEPDGPAT